MIVCPIVYADPQGHSDNIDAWRDLHITNCFLDLRVIGGRRGSICISCSLSYLSSLFLCTFMFWNYYRDVYLRVCTCTFKFLHCEPYVKCWKLESLSIVGKKNFETKLCGLCQEYSRLHLHFL